MAKMAGFYRNEKLRQRQANSVGSRLAQSTKQVPGKP